MYSLMRSIVRNVQLAVPASHLDHVFPLNLAASCRTVAGFTPRASAYFLTSAMNCSMAQTVGFYSYIVNSCRRFFFRLRQAIENRKIFL